MAAPTRTARPAGPRSVAACLALSIVIVAVLGTMLLTGYVPARLVGPMNERIFTVFFGLGTGLLMAVGLRIVLDGR